MDQPRRAGESLLGWAVRTRRAPPHGEQHRYWRATIAASESAAEHVLGVMAPGCAGPATAAVGAGGADDPDALLYDPRDRDRRPWETAPARPVRAAAGNEQDDEDDEDRHLFDPRERAARRDRARAVVEGRAVAHGYSPRSIAAMREELDREQ